MGKPWENVAIRMQSVETLYVTVHYSDVSNHQRLDCLLNRLFGRRSKKRLKLRVTGLCEGNSPVTGEFPSQRAITREVVPFDDVIT